MAHRKTDPHIARLTDHEATATSIRREQTRMVRDFASAFIAVLARAANALTARLSAGSAASR